MRLPIMKVTPDSLNYHDRGIMKCLRMMLSDHSEALKKEKLTVEYSEQKQKEELSMSEVGKLLYKAYVLDLPIKVQANILQNGNYYPDL